jgi:transcriptional regulator with XRE-family HTH domain
MVKEPNWPVDRFGDLLSRIFRETGLNRAKLAGLVGMNPSQVSRWLTGANKPNAESLVAIGEVLRKRYPDLDVGPDELLASVYGPLLSDSEAPPTTAVPGQVAPSRVSGTGDGTSAIDAALKQIEAVAAALRAEMQEEIAKRDEVIAAKDAEIVELRRKLERPEDGKDEREAI